MYFWQILYVKLALHSTVKPPNYGLLTNGNSFIRNKFSYINLFPCHLIVNNVSKQRKFPYPEHGNLLNVK